MAGNGLVAWVPWRFVDSPEIQPSPILWTQEHGLHLAVRGDHVTGAAVERFGGTAHPGERALHFQLDRATLNALEACVAEGRLRWTKKAQQVRDQFGGSSFEEARSRLEVDPDVSVDELVPDPPASTAQEEDHENVQVPGVQVMPRHTRSIAGDVGIDAGLLVAAFCALCAIAAISAWIPWLEPEVPRDFVLEDVSWAVAVASVTGFVVVMLGGVRMAPLGGALMAGACTAVALTMFTLHEILDLLGWLVDVSISWGAWLALASTAMATFVALRLAATIGE